MARHIVPCSWQRAAATLKRELTLPGLAQSLVLTRTSGRASAMPERERLATFAASGATLAIHLSIHVAEQVVAELSPFYGETCPVAIVFRASWPDERVLRGTLSTIAAQVLILRRLDAAALEQLLDRAEGLMERPLPLCSTPRIVAATLS